jgi:hypothetical protein
MTSVDHTLKVAAATPAPAPQIDVVREWQAPRDCDRDHGREHHHPEV